MIWDVKILLAKIKDCKGKELKSSAKKKMPTKTPPKSGEKTFFKPLLQLYFGENVRAKCGLTVTTIFPGKTGSVSSFLSC
jgi:hypothetical protein